MPTELANLVSLVGLRADRAVKLVSGGSSLRHDFDVNPQDFLDQAEFDFEFGGNAALLNAVTNAKRAITCQIDQVLSCFGFKIARITYQDKIAQLAAMGFVAPRILRRVSNTRNLLEHEYKAPTEDQVAEALDLAALFVEASNRPLGMFMDEFDLVDKDEVLDHYSGKRGLSFSYRQKPDAKETISFAFRVIAYDNGETRPELGVKPIAEPCFVANDSPYFAPLVRLVVAGDNTARIDRATSSLFMRLASGGA